MEPLTQPLIALVNDTGVFGYWFAFIAAFAETLLVVGLLLPGSALILLMGMLAGQGYLDLGDLVGFAVAGAILGDNANYWLGRRYGRRWLSQDRWFFKTEHLHKAEDFFRRHGGKSVFLARFVPSLKEVVPFIAGMAHMRRAPFHVVGCRQCPGHAIGARGGMIHDEATFTQPLVNKLCGLGFVFNQKDSHAESLNTSRLAAKSITNTRVEWAYAG